MATKGIRGAITVDNNTEDAIKSATLELLNEQISQNKIEISQISHVIFTLTDDLNAAFPANPPPPPPPPNEVAMMCFHELNVPNSLKSCLRTLIVVNCDDNFTPKFVYLKDAAKLR